MSTTNWYTVRNELVTKLDTETSLNTVTRAVNEMAADTLTVAYPAAVIVKGRVQRIGDPYQSPGVRYWQRCEYHVYYYTSEGLPNDLAEQELGTILNAGRLKLEAFMPTTQVDNSSLLLWDSEEDLEKYGARGDGSDGLKVRQTYVLDQLTYAVPS